ncbi:MAG: hypothetical protein LBG15_08935 [Dysgonamonadaceae bacterium]|jgi:hypothetical protein|nr:hypothetical protein [Dysgonamonadaceae bacterium]
MKKIIIAALLCTGAISFVVAQDADETIKSSFNKRGASYLPEAGDFALGIDASPFLEYLGNLFNQAGTNKAPTFGNGFGIYGKYFVENNRAIRAKLYMEFSKTKYQQTVPDDYEILTNPTNLYATGIDTQNDFNNNILLNIGYEFRRGKGRLQGFYGADFALGYSNFKTTYDYTNPITLANQAPSTADFTGNYGRRSSRILEDKRTSNFTLGLGAFVGVEYFISPLISVGGEANLNFRYSVSGQSEVTSERILGNSVYEYKYRQKTADKNNPNFISGFYTRPTGTLFIMFHF